MYLNTDSLIEINIINIGLNNVTPRKFNVKLYRSDKRYTDKEPIQDKLYQIIFQFNGRKTGYGDFYFVLLENIHSFYDGNGRKDFNKIRIQEQHYNYKKNLTRKEYREIFCKTRTDKLNY